MNKTRLLSFATSLAFLRSLANTHTHLSGGVVVAHRVSGPISSILHSRSLPLIGHGHHFDRVDGL